MKCLGIISIQLLKCMKLISQRWYCLLFATQQKTHTHTNRKKEISHRRKVIVQSDRKHTKHDWSLINTSANWFKSLIYNWCSFFSVHFTNFIPIKWIALACPRARTIEQKLAAKVFRICSFQLIFDKIEKLIALSLPIFNCILELAFFFYFMTCHRALAVIHGFLCVWVYKVFLFEFRVTNYFF